MKHYQSPIADMIFAGCEDILSNSLQISDQNDISSAMDLDYHIFD